LVVVLALGAMPGNAVAQVTWQPTAAPTVSAENEAWYRAGEPIMFNDANFYPAGATVFFNRYQMVRTGSYRGIPLYMDSTQDAFGILYVPIGHGLMQPYERRREGPLAGTTGNRAPSFPVSTPAEEAIEESMRPRTLVEAQETYPVPEPESTTGRSIVEAPRADAGTVVRPKGINGVWVEFEGRRWFSDGKAVPFDSRFTRAGEYRGFTVYRMPKDADRIYVPTSNGMVAPYSAAQRRAKSTKPKDSKSKPKR
jgi:hypothetical protein